MTNKVSHSRWRFAQQHQREYQENKARLISDRGRSLVRAAEAGSAGVSEYLRRLGHSPETGFVVEVGSGASGLIWSWPGKNRLAIDPLAHFYRETFPEVQSNGPWIVQAQGEQLPLPGACVDMVLSDNVLDHVEDPSAYLAECRRILKPGGILYMTVDVHHPIYWWAGRSYNLLYELGLRADVPAFPNHPFHFTVERIDKLVAGADFRICERRKPAAHKALRQPVMNLFRHTQQYVKSLFFKNARYALVATT